MSHTMNIKLELHDKAILKTVCEKLKIPMEQGKHQLYKGQEEGLGIKLPGWKYPAVVKDDGTVAYDNYNGSWGKIEELNMVTAHYGLEKAKHEAILKGYSTQESYNEQTRELELTVNVEGY